MQSADFDLWLADPHRAPLVMGVLNVTPDSFSDGSRFMARDAAAAHAREMVAQGARILDIGGESTRPGSQPVPADEQIRRVVPVIQSIRGDLAAIISVDTTSAPVAEAALDAGAQMVNDISAGRDDPRMFPLVARRGAAMVLMHMQGTPATMQQAPAYLDVTAEAAQFLNARITAATESGIDPTRLLIDPGIGFGKTVEHNLDLLRRLPLLAAAGRPLVIGASRKAFIGKITGQTDPLLRVFGTAATVAWAVANGAAVVRVHDVEPMVQVVSIIRAIQARPNPDFLKV